MILNSIDMTGYGHPLYATSLSPFGQPLALPLSAGWVLKRQIPDTPHYDAMGCYPIFSCANWALLKEDLNNMDPGIVSLSLVTDPFGDYSFDFLRECFTAVCYPFKEHFVVDLCRPDFDFISDHHKRNLRKASHDITVERCADPLKFLDDWTDLYSVLITRHQIRGISAFSRDVFAKQLAVPGIAMFRAVSGDTTVGALLWYVHGETAYYHLGAYNEEGYTTRAAFGLMHSALEYFKGRGVRQACLGAGAGAGSDGADGLTRYKRGWATGTRTAYFCGRIFDYATYESIVKARAVVSTNYFPRYRAGEFS